MTWCKRTKILASGTAERSWLLGAGTSVVRYLRGLSVLLSVRLPVESGDY